MRPVDEGYEAWNIAAPGACLTPPVDGVPIQDRCPGHR